VRYRAKATGLSEVTTQHRFQSTVHSALLKSISPSPARKASRNVQPVRRPGVICSWPPEARKHGGLAPRLLTTVLKLAAAFQN